MRTHRRSNMFSATACTYRKAKPISKIEWHNTSVEICRSKFSALHDVLRAAAKTQVPIALVGPSLVFRHNIGWILVRLSTEETNCPLTLKLASPAFHPDIAINNQVVSNLAKSNGALFINRVAHFCDDGSCLLQPLNGSVPYIYDTQHLSVTGIEHFAEQLSKNEKLSKFLETDTRR